MNLSNDLFIRLINHRITNTISRKEDFLTEIFCWILEQDHALAESFLDLVGLSHIENRTILSIRTQVQLGSYGRVDAQIQSSKETLLIECKVDASYDAEQIKRYLDHANSVNAKVLAIIPAIQKMNVESPKHPQFVDVLTWESIYTWLNESLTNSSPILQPHIESTLALLRHYRLEPIDRTIASWEDQSLERNRKYIRAVGASINTFVPHLNTLLNKHRNPPKWYSGEGTGIVPGNGSGFLYSGKGPSPRPILGHNLQLISNFGYPWCRLDFYLGFISHYRAPHMRIQFWTGDANNTLHLLNLMGIKAKSPDGVIDHEQYQTYMMNCMEYIVQKISKQFPMFRDIQTSRSSGFVSFFICDTCEILEKPDQPHLVKPIIHHLYESIFTAFLNWEGWKEDWTCSNYQQ